MPAPPTIVRMTQSPTLRSRRRLTALAALSIAAGLAGLAGAGGALASLNARSAIVTTYDAGTRGVLATSGGYTYCGQALPIARRLGYTLVCGRYVKDGYVGPGTRARRWLDWGNPAYLNELAAGIAAVHRRVGGPLVLVGVSYSGYGVATLVARHPELRPTRVVVVDSYLDLVARRSRLPGWHETAREIDRETGGTRAALAARGPSIAGLAKLVRGGTQLHVIWSVSPAEAREFRGATCNRGADAGPLAALARQLGRPFTAWVTRNRHGVTFWRYGSLLAQGGTVGTKMVFPPTGTIPPGSTCP